MIFEFERDFAGTLRCIPMIVRFNLDLCGIKLSLKQWSRLGRENRAALATLRCLTWDEIGSYRRDLIAAIRTRAGGEVMLIGIEARPEWEERSFVPVQLAAFAASKHISSIDAERWAALSDLQRFALCKLTRASHDNNNFEPAMIEFGLLRN